MKTLNLLLLALLLAVISSCWKMDNPLDPEVNADMKVALPAFNPAGGTYPQGQTVTITCATVGATIRYTTDGAEPGSNSAIYTGPVSVQVPTTIKAKAFKAGWPDSQTSTASYTLQVATPTFSPVGGVYDNNINLSINCATVGATIRYTIDGSEPDATSTLYSTPISVTGNTTIKAKAFKIGWPDSQMATASYTFQVATPTFSPAGGVFFANVNVSISCATAGATIRYTTDGAEPNTNSTLYSNPINVTGSTTIKAKAFKTGWLDSLTGLATYEFQVASPTFNPPGGTYSTQPIVKMSCITPGVTIRYTTDGTEPHQYSYQYINPVTIVSTTTLKAKAIKAGWVSSQTATATYEIMLSDFVHVSGSTFNNGTSNVTLSSFYIDKYEVTQAFYHSVMGTNPSYFTGVANGPVERVSWFDAIEYCNRRSMQEGRTPCYNYSTHGPNPANWPDGWNTDNANHTNVSCSWTANGYRLPTEMEWMFAAKGGIQSLDYNYSGSNTVGNVAWYSGNSGSSTHTVGTRAYNEILIHDMSGNVWEWVWDIWGISYPYDPQNNPHGPDSGSSRVFRGGSWGNGANSCIVASRSGTNADMTDNVLGFRCVRILP